MRLGRRLSIDGWLRKRNSRPAKWLSPVKKRKSWRQKTGLQGRSRTRAIAEGENGIAGQVRGKAERDRFPAKADRRSRDSSQAFGKSYRCIDIQKAIYLASSPRD